MLIALAALHCAVGGVLYARELAGVLAAGAFAGISDFEPAAAALWFLVAGGAIGLLGTCEWERQRVGLAPARGLPLGLSLLATFAVVIMPLSGAWLLFPIAWRAAFERRAAKSA
jgi:hypothetical protein